MTVTAESLLSQAADIARTHWGFEGEVTRLPGENVNVLCDRRVLKISVEEQADPDLEESVATALAAAGLPVPVSLESIDGRVIVPVEIAGHSGTARMQDCLPGACWRDLDLDSAGLSAIGACVAEVHAALEGFAHPQAERTHPWDLARAGQHRTSVSLIEDRDLRLAAEYALHLHAACDLRACPRGMLHGDINDENVLLEGGRVSGVLDLGDTLSGALVQDLAITVAYALQHGDPESVASVVAGYDAVRALSLAEQQVLVPLVLGRLATSACVAARRVAEDPEHATWFSHLQSTRDSLVRLAALSPRSLERSLCAQCRVRRSVDSDTQSLALRRGASLPGVLSLSYEEPLHIVRGRGQYLFASDGRPYLDLVNNVCHVGHCHPSVVSALGDQAAVLNTNTRYLHDHVVRYAERLTSTMPDGLDVCFLVNSGSEANELALRLARAATGASDVLVVDGAYHGSTGTCIDMSPYKFNGPGGGGCPDWVHVVPMPDVYRGDLRDETAGAGYALEVGRVIGEATGRGRSIAGFFVESLLSCGGQIPLPDGYLAAAFEHVRAAGGLCIADEVQVGFGRVGEVMWGFELQGVVPDIVVLGKPMGNGHPIGAVVTTRAVAETFDNGMEFFSTFGGNPVSAAVGLAVLDVIEREGLQARASALGTRMLDGLRMLQARHTMIGDVRGGGLFIGVELVRDRSSLEPADTEAAAVVNMMKAHGVLLSTDGPLHNVIKIKPPMVLDEADVDMTLRLLDEVLRRMTL